MTILSSVASALDTWRMIRCPGKIAEKKWPFVLLFMETARSKGTR